MRIALAGFNLESVSFLPGLTSIADFEHFEARGDDIPARFRDTNTVMGGFIDACEEAGFDMLPIVQTEAGARGPAEDAAFEHYAEMIENALKEAGRIDGVLLHLHGALTTPSRTDPDGDLAARVRAAIGPDIPLILALDYHANLDHASIAPANATFGYHFSPHIDMGDTGRRAGRCMARTLRGEIRPVSALVRPGLMVPSILSATSLEPLAGFVQRSIELPSHVPGVLDASVFAGFSYADVPNCGFSVVVVTDGDTDLAREQAQALSDAIWAERVAIYKPGFALPLGEGIDHAVSRAKNASRPVVILEHADRMNDSTHVLRALLEKGVERAAVPYLWDPITARQAAMAGAGVSMTFRLGGHSDLRTGGPVEVEAQIIWAGPKTYIGTGPMRRNSLINLGLAAHLRVAGIDVILTETPVTCIDTDPFTEFGLKPEDFGIVVLRSKTHFRAVWEDISEEIVIVDTPDWGPADLTTLPYRHVPRADIYPFCEAG